MRKASLSFLALLLIAALGHVVYAGLLVGRAGSVGGAAPSAAPVSTVAPVVNATNLANGSGGAISVSTGTWQNCSSCTYSYSWYTEQPGTPTTTGRIVQTQVSAPSSSPSYTPSACSSSPCPLLLPVVTATNSVGTTYSIPPQLVGPVPLTEPGVPVNTAVPTIGGTNPRAIGYFLSVSNGTWTNSPVGYAYQWYDSTGSSCTSPTPISGATSSTYMPQTTDIGDYVCASITATNSQGPSTPSYTTTGAFLPASTLVPYAGTTVATISGTPQVGQVVSVPSPSTVCNTFDSYFAEHGSPPGVNFPVQATCTYQWYDWNGTTATAISGANSNSYLVQTPDVGFQLEVTISGTDNTGTGTLPVIGPTATVTTPSSVPVNTAADSIYSNVSGSTCTTTSTWKVGCQLFVTLGTWTNSPTLYNYQWCSSGIAHTSACAAGYGPISGATGYFYNISSTDQGNTIELQVIAENNIGNSATETTAATGTIVETGVPVNSAIPTITGNPVQGGLLTASTGTWTLFPTSYAYQWQRNGTNISGATSQTYTLVSADVGNPITVTVTPTNSVGAGSPATSNATGTVTNPGGLLTGCSASISGTAEAGAALTASISGCSPTSETYAWSSGGSPVGTNSSTYTLAESDVGNTVTVSITPTNAVGTSPPVTSSPTVAITNPPAPSGGTVTATTNSPIASQPASWSDSGFTGIGTITKQYETCVGTWSGSSCTGTLAGWPAETYVPSASDVGQQLTYIVIATNLGGSTTAYATASSTVANPAASTNTFAPQIVGTAEVGNDLVSTIGVWTSVQTQFNFQWCSSGIAHTSACATGYGPISGATAQRYTLQSSDLGNTIEVGVTAVNLAGNVTAFSAPTSAVTAFPYTSGACGGWASSTFYDGCAHAPPAGPYTIQHANLFSGYAQRSGQVYPSGFGCKSKANCHPPWAVAGADYPVGVSCGTSCGFGAPGTATDPTYSGANYNGGNPGGCAQVTTSSTAWTASWSSANGGTATYTFTAASPAFFWIGGKVVISGFSPSGYNGTFLNPPIPPSGNNELVHNQTFTVPMATNPGAFVSAGTVLSYENRISCNTPTSSIVDIGPMDFSGAGNPGGQALTLTVNNGGTGGCIIHDSLLAYDTNQSVQSGLSANLFTGCQYLILRNDTMEVRDTSGAQAPEFPAMWNDNVEVWNSTGTNTGPTPQVLNIPTIEEYDAYVACPARCTGFAGMLEHRFNYIEGLNAYTTTGSGAHGDGVETSFYNGPIGFHTPCYCTGGDMVSLKFDTWLPAPSANMTGTAGAIDCVICGLINVPEGSISGWTTGDGILHVVSGSDVYGDYPTVHVVLNTSAALVTQCKDGAGNVGCSLSQFKSCSPTAPCEYALDNAVPACPAPPSAAGQLCTFTYVYAATFNTGDMRNDVVINNITNGNGSAGTGQAVGYPIPNTSTISGIGYGDYENLINKNNYINFCGQKQGAGNGVWNTGFPLPYCIAPPTPTLASGAVPSTTLGTGTSGNLYGGGTYASGPTTQGDNVLMDNGACLLAFGSINAGGFQPNPITDCATTAPP